jgi:hypothetical protein
MLAARSSPGLWPSTRRARRRRVLRAVPGQGRAPRRSRSRCAISSHAVRTMTGVTPVTFRPHRRTDDNRSGTHSVHKLPWFLRKLRGIAASRSWARNGLLPGMSVRIGATQALLAMQKVEGSNPFSRFRKGLPLQAFFACAVGWCVCVAGHPLGTGGAARGGSASRSGELRLLCRQFAGDSNH